MSKNNNKSLSNDFFELMIFLHKTIFNPTELAKILPMPLSHFKVLHYIADKKSSTASDIADALNINRPNVTPIIDYLISKEFITKIPDPNDRRYHIIEITDRGKDILRLKSDTMKDKLSQALNPLSEKDRNDLKDSISTIYKILTKSLNE